MSDDNIIDLSGFQTPEQPVEDNRPNYRDYVIRYTDGEEINVNGFMIATNTFYAVAHIDDKHQPEFQWTAPFEIVRDIRIA